MQQGKKGLRIATWFNILLSFVAVGALVIMGIAIYQYAKEIIGLKYAKEMGDYAKNLKNTLNSHSMKDKTELVSFSKKIKELISALNATEHMKTSGKTIAIPTGDVNISNVDTYFKTIKDNMTNFSKESSTQSAFFGALVNLVKNEDKSLTGILPINDDAVKFAKSLIEFSKLVSFDEIAKPILDGKANVKSMVMLLLNGMKKWFIQTKGLFFIGLVTFASTWLLSIISAICLKSARRRRNMSGGTGLIIWTILLPIFGFIFYPILSLSYTVRKN